MNDLLLLYLFTRLDALQGLLIAAIVVVILLSVFLFMFGAENGFFAYDHEGKEKAAFYRRAKYLAGMVSLCASMVVLIPSKQDAAIMVGGWYAIKAARSEQGQELAGEVLAAIRAQLREAAKE